VSTVGFIGLGHMGHGMSLNLLKSSHKVIGYDLNEQVLNEFQKAGGVRATSIAEVARNSDIVITMLPKGAHVKSVYLGDDGVIANAGHGKLFIDSSTIDIETSVLVAEKAAKEGHRFLDAPVSGGEKGASNGTLSFMVGGDEATFEQATPILSLMGSSLFYVGKNGSGLAVKLVNNMLLGITMAATGEAFNLIERLGVDPKKFYAIASKSTGSNWALNENCPVPGILEESPASHDYKPGFAAGLMLKDLCLGQQIAINTNASTPFGALATSIFSMACHSGLADQDMSAVIKFLAGNKS
jgi:3-hydroxyisobutyrate dehydrogenase